MARLAPYRTEGSLNEGATMPSSLEGFAFADWDAPAVFIFFAVLVLTDRLVWHKRLDKAEIERNYWRDIALKALGVAEGVTTAAEVLTTDAELAKERERS